MGYLAIRDDNGSAEKTMREFAKSYGFPLVVVRGSVSGIAAVDSKLLSLVVSDEGTAANLRKLSM